MKLEAYLGPKKPETLVVGEHYGSAVPSYGVVKQHRETGEILWVAAYDHYGSAMSRLNSATNHHFFGILTLLRAPGVAETVESTNAQIGVLDRVSI